jgi:hypothetical protein
MVREKPERHIRHIEGPTRDNRYCYRHFHSGGGIHAPPTLHGEGQNRDRIAELEPATGIRLKCINRRAITREGLL